MRRLWTIFIALCLVLCCSCAPVEDGQPISYLQTGSLFGQEGNYRLCVRSGQTEKPVVIDGTRGEMTSFAVMSLKVLDQGGQNGAYSYKILVGDEQVVGEFVKDRFGANYSAELPQSVDVSKLTAVSIICGDTETAVPLTNVMADLVVDGGEALTIARETLAADLAKEEGEGISREIHVKFVNDGHNPESKYYWYVAFVRPDAPFFAVLIDPDDGTVVAKR